MEDLTNQLDHMTQQIRRIRHNLIVELESAGAKDAGRVVIEECFEWAREIQKKYPETYHSVRSYYAMATGNPPRDAVADDFEGDDSALLFLAKLRHRLLKDYPL